MANTAVDTSTEQHHQHHLHLQLGPPLPRDRCGCGPLSSAGASPALHGQHRPPPASTLLPIHVSPCHLAEPLPSPSPPPSLALHGEVFAAFVNWCGAALSRHVGQMRHDDRLLQARAGSEIQENILNHENIV